VLELQIPASLRLTTHCFGIAGFPAGLRSFSLSQRTRRAILRFTAKKQIFINKKERRKE